MTKEVYYGLKLTGNNFIMVLNHPAISLIGVTAQVHHLSSYPFNF